MSKKCMPYREQRRKYAVQVRNRCRLCLFRPLRRWSEASLVEAVPLTGRTHQIRVHAAHLGQPIAGDEKYGDAAFNRRMQEKGLRRLFLHAASLRFSTADGESIAVSAPLDPALMRVLTAMGKSL